MTKKQTKQKYRIVGHDFSTIMGREFVIRNCSRFALCVKKNNKKTTTSRIDLNCFPLILALLFFFPFHDLNLVQCGNIVSIILTKQQSNEIEKIRKVAMLYVE